MAKKNQKFKKYSFEFKQMVIDLYINQKWPASRISKKFNVPIATVGQWAYKLNHGVNIYKNNKIGMNKKHFTKDDLEEQVEIFKKIPNLLKSTTREKVTFIDNNINVYKLRNMCAALGICKRTYYKYRNQIDPDYTDYLLIKQVFRDSKCTYGYRRIKEGLMNKYGVIFNHKKLRGWWNNLI